MNSPEAIRDLVQAYKDQFRDVGANGLNEAETRIRFLDNLFRSLGWDVGSPTSSRVVVELRREQGAPDYMFLSADRRETAFLVEAKRATDPLTPFVRFPRDQVFQAKRYAYSLGVPIVVLTNFALTQVFAVTGPPDILDPDQFELPELNIPIDSLQRDFSKLASLLSREAVDAGSIEDLLERRPREQKMPLTAKVLEKMLAWRVKLANGFARANPSAIDSDIDLAVEALIDKLIFCKILIDKDLEDDFLTLSSNLPDQAAYLRERFGMLEQKYNGGLFSAGDALGLAVAEDTLRGVVSDLTSPKLPYTFSRIPIEILGDIYETFIGVRVVRLKGAMTLELRENLKKEHGIFFTPRRVVGYMVDLAMGEMLKDKSYQQLLRLRIVDPASGSGSFLVAAYRLLIARAEEWWKAQPDTSQRRRALASRDGIERLNLERRREILDRCIFGADRDPKAIELAAMSLYLVLIEDHNTQFSLHHSALLPSILGKNLLVRDSIVSDGSIASNALNWADDFREPDGEPVKFDVCLANPPYVFGEHVSDQVKQHLENAYTCQGEQVDYYALFLELCLTRILKKDGIYAFIVPDALLARRDREDLRKLMLRIAPPRFIWHVGTCFEKIDVSDLEMPKISRNVTGVSAVVVVGQLTRHRGATYVLEDSRSGLAQSNVIDVGMFERDSASRFMIQLTSEGWETVFKMLSSGRTLADLLVPGSNGKLLSRGEETGKKHLSSDRSPQARIPVIPGESVDRFHLKSKRFFVTSLSKPVSMYRGPKVLIRKTDTRSIACLDDSDTATLQSVYMCRGSNGDQNAAIVAILNSALINWYIEKTITAYKKLMPQLTQEEILGIPVPGARVDVASLVADVIAQGSEARQGLLPGARAKYRAALASIERILADAYGVDVRPDEGELSLLDLA